MYVGAIALRTYIPWILWAELGVTAIMPTSSGEWIVATLKFTCHLFVCGATSGYQYHMETSQTKYGYGQYCYYTH